MISRIIILLISSLFILNLGVYAQSKPKLLAVPNVVGMTFKDAKRLLQRKGINIGAIAVDGPNEGGINTKGLDTLIVYRGSIGILSLPATRYRLEVKVQV